MAQSNDAPSENYWQPSTGEGAEAWSNYASNPELGQARLRHSLRPRQVPEGRCAAPARHGHGPG